MASSPKLTRREEALRRFLHDQAAGSNLGRRFFSIDETYILETPENTSGEADAPAPSSAIKPLFW